MNDQCKKLATTPALRRLWGIPEDVEHLIGIATEADAALTELSDIPLDDGEEATTIPRAWREMTDVEIVLRFFANRQRMIVYRDNIRGYLDAYLQAANHFEPRTIAALAGLFEDTINLAEAVFGDKAFRRTRGGNWTTVPSVSIYDALMNVLSRLLDRSDELIEKKEQIQAGLPAFYLEYSNVFNLRGQKRADVMTREVVFDQYMRAFINA
jgi:hypothetical protein